MAQDASSIDWPLLYRTAFVVSSHCWEVHACGSYCCRTSHPDFDFRFIREDMVWLPMTPMEYRYLAGVDELQDYDKGNIVRHGVEFLPGRTASVYMMRCKQGGACRSPDFRPLICRIYPYFPVPDVHGQVTQVVASSIFDHGWEVKRGQVGCPMRATQPDAETGLVARFAEPMGHLFKYPAMIFYFRAAWRLMELMKERLRTEHAALLALPNREFWARWEMLYLTQELFPAERVRALLAEEYAAVAEIWGDFETL